MVRDPGVVLIESAEKTVYEALLNEITRGLPPGTPLRLADVARRLGVSTMPVRKALVRLEAEGLVRHEHRRGATVAPLELDDLEEIQALRSGIEGLAARLGAARIDSTGLSRMGGHLRALRATVERGELDGYLAISTQLEDECYAASGRARLQDLVNEHRRAAQRYVRVAVGFSPGYQIGFHERLFYACLTHEGAAAEAVIREALQWVYLQVAEHLPEYPEPASKFRSISRARVRPIR